MRFWSKLLGRIAIIVVLVPSAFAYEAPQLILVSLAVAWSAGALSLERYRANLLGEPSLTAPGFRELAQRLATVEQRQDGDVLDVEDRYLERLADLEERLDFTERLLARQEQQKDDYPTPV